MIEARSLPSVNPVRAGFPLAPQGMGPVERGLSSFRMRRHLGAEDGGGVMDHLKNPWVAGGLGVVAGAGLVLLWQRMQG